MLHIGNQHEVVVQSGITYNCGIRQSRYINLLFYEKTLGKNTLPSTYSNFRIVLMIIASLFKHSPQERYGTELLSYDGDKILLIQTNYNGDKNFTGIMTGINIVAYPAIANLYTAIAKNQKHIYCDCNHIPRLTYPAIVGST